MCADRRSAEASGRYAEVSALATRIMEVTGISLETILSLDPVAQFPQYHQQIRKELG
jgi:hypothetical protein